MELELQRHGSVFNFKALHGKGWSWKWHKRFCPGKDEFAAQWENSTTSSNLKTRFLKWIMIPNLEKLPNWDWFPKRWFPKMDEFPYLEEFYCKNPNIIFKWFSWFKRAFLMKFSMDYRCLDLKEMNLRILKILEKLDFSWTSWSLGLTWTNVLRG